MIIGYIRVSTGKQHPENQQDEITRYAKENNMVVDRWVTEIVSRESELQQRKHRTKYILTNQPPLLR